MRPANKFLLPLLALFFFGGCATKIDLYKYKDISSAQIVDEDKANYKVVKHKLNPNIAVDGGEWHRFEDSMRDYFLANNDRKSIFDIDEKDAYILRLNLQNLESSRKFHPSEFVKTKKGGYTTKAYWSYTVSSAVTAELRGTDGKKKFFDASDSYSYSINSNNPSVVPREKYLKSLQDTMDSLLNKIANELAPEGLIVSKKVAIDDDEDNIFMVNMGSYDGLRREQRVIVYKEFIFKNEIDAETVSNKVLIGGARVSDQIMPHYAWIVLDDAAHNSVIEVGDIIRPVYR